MPETITSYNTFVANTKAKASETNTNFSNYRGTYLPITTNTATASDNLYNVGSTEYRFVTVYTSAVDYRTSTSTATVTTEADTAVTTGAWYVKIEGVVKARVDTDGLDGEFLKDGSVSISSWASRGSGTTTASVPQVGYRAFENSFSTTVTSDVDVTGSTITVTTIGRPVLVGIFNDNNTMSSMNVIFDTIGAFNANQVSQLHICRNGSIIARHQGGMNVSFTTTAINSANKTLYLPTSITIVDFPAAGSNIYHVEVRVPGAAVGVNINAKIFAVEI